jgi:peptidyl-prolyl cis-trans isomerase SurA
MFFAATAAAQTSLKIIALVNGEIISSEDIDHRMRAFSLTANVPINPETEGMMFQRVLHNTIDEKLKLQDSAANGVKISPKDINDAVSSFEQNNKMQPGDLKKLLKSKNISFDIFKKQMESDLAWVRLIRRKVSGEAVITQAEVEDALADAKKDLSLPKYLVYEIFVKNENAKEIDKLHETLLRDPRFELYAVQFSEAPSAASGGNLGWANKGSFIPALEEALANMGEGQISKPIKVEDGYYILKLIGSFDPKVDSTPQPNENDIRTFLENKRLETLANNHLQRLRQKAIIELRN